MWHTTKVFFFFISKYNSFLKQIYTHHFGQVSLMQFIWTETNKIALDPAHDTVVGIS